MPGWTHMIISCPTLYTIVNKQNKIADAKQKRIETGHLNDFAFNRWQDSGKVLKCFPEWKAPDLNLKNVFASQCTQDTKIINS